MASGVESLRLLVVDDEEDFVKSLSTLLREDHDVRVAFSAEDALRTLKVFVPHLVLLDVKLPGGDGLDCLRRIKEERPEVEVVMLTGFAEVESAVAAMKLGACDYIRKPVGIKDIEKVIRGACGKARARPGALKTPSREQPQDAYRIVGTSQAVERIAVIIEQVSCTDLTVLVEGESGTGKELIARTIHRESNHSDGPFVAVNCARFSGELTNSELFGHEKGSFTGADSLRKGVFERADGGTLLLDEIGTMPLATQDRLLRVVEEKRVTRVGGEKPIDLDVRFIFATNRDLEAEAEKGLFREDLYFRIKVVAISVPPLRSRSEDIPLLVEHFLRKHRSAIGLPHRSFTPEAISALQSRQWRGNVRELENTVRMLMSLCDKRVLDADDLESLAPQRSALSALRIHQVCTTRVPPRPEADRGAILAALDACNWNQSLTSRHLGVHRNTLRNMMKRLDIRVRHLAE